MNRSPTYSCMPILVTHFETKLLVIHYAIPDPHPARTSLVKEVSSIPSLRSGL